ncbi:hypothetical protein PG996_008469 [Apiospora saccharicola]|uniref:Signal recognition particle subunit SRP72 n=1 Tax=Apiospora saccharicola TaxID=335842 RepID=A0ABR1UYP5_9PEZI
MGGFGASVSALDDTYTRCLRLLKAFKGRGGSGDTAPNDPALEKANAHLRDSIRSDRSQIRKAYSSKLSKSGNRLERGDAPSKAAIRRILDRLKAAIKNLLSMVKTQKPALDYQSLMSLSNASRVDAIRTMEHLSMRLSSSSGLFHEHRRPVSRSSSSSTKKKARRQLSEDNASDVSGERPRSRRHSEAGSSDDRTGGKSSRRRRSRKESQDSSSHHTILPTNGHAQLSSGSIIRLLSISKAIHRTRATPARKPNPNQTMSDPAAALASLLRASSIQDHDEILKAANAAIKASKSDLQAQHTRLVALLKLDRFDDALRALAEGGDRLEKECLLEKAYTLYKTGKLDEAEKLIKTTSEPTRALRHLAAQVAYRAEKFQDAAAIYRSLPDEGEGRDGEENDLKINTLATSAQLEWEGKGHLLNDEERKPSNDVLEAFETAYNAACGCVARGDLSKASVLLKRARDLCNANEDLTDEEKKAELLPIMVQHAYVLTRLGKEAEALALQKSIVVADIPEAPTKVVAQNNAMAMGSEEQNPYLTSRLIESATVLSGNDKMFGYQAAVLGRNRYALDLQSQKFAGVESATSKKISSASSPTASSEIAPLGVISAAAHAHMRTGKDAIREILPILEKRPTDIGLLLTIIQLYVQTQNPGPALSLLQTFLKRLETATTPDHEDVRYAPGLVAVAVSLYRLQGRQNSIRTELAKASKHWRSKSDDSAMPLLRGAGVELLKSSSAEDLASAGATFENLVSNAQNDKAAIAGLVASYATTDYAKIEPYLQHLTAVDRLTAGVDARALLDAGVASVSTAAAPLSKKRVADADADQTSKRRRKKKKLPKDYEEGKQPDPERWLPLRDRSTYRPKGKKGKKRAQEATQGGMVKEEEMLELVGGAGAVKVEKAAPQGGGGNKKKKKGKK